MGASARREQGCSKNKRPYSRMSVLAMAHTESRPTPRADRGWEWELDGKWWARSRRLGMLRRVSNTERVAALEALLDRIHKNAGGPRVSWRTGDLGPMPDLAPVKASVAQPAARIERPVAPPVAVAHAQRPQPRSALDPAVWNAQSEAPVDAAADRLAAAARAPAHTPVAGIKATVPTGTPRSPSLGVKGFGGGAAQRPSVSRVEPPVAAPEERRAPSPVAPPVAAKPIERAAPVPVSQVVSVEGSNEPIAAAAASDLPVVDGGAAPLHGGMPEDPFAVTRPVEASEAAQLVAALPAPIEPPRVETPVEAELSSEPIEETTTERPEPELAPAPGVAVEPAFAPEPRREAVAEIEAAREPALPEPIVAQREADKPVPAEPPPSFSSASEEAPSKFATESVRPAPKKKGSISYLLVTAFLAVVVGAGVLVYLRSREEKTPPPPKPQPTGAATSMAPATATATAAATESPATTATADVTATASAEASAAPTDPTTPPSDPKTLPSTKAYLFVQLEGEEGTVFTSGGSKVGELNQWVEVNCNGGKGLYVAIAKSGSTVPRAGRPVPIACQSAKTVKFTSADLNAPIPAPPRAPPTVPTAAPTSPAPTPTPAVNPQEP